MPDLSGRIGVEPGPQRAAHGADFCPMILLFLLYLASAIACWFVARWRRADTRFWLLAGLLAGPLALPFVFFAKPRP